MTGLFNTGIRDYCGEESSVTKLSNHFSKDFAFQQEGINDLNNSHSASQIPKSFNLDELLQDATNRNQQLSQIRVKSEDSIVKQVDSTRNIDVQEQISVDKWKDPPLNQPTGNYFPVSNYAIPHNIPANQFSPPEQSLIAEQWAKNELSQFDSKIINEEDLTRLSENNDTSTIRFFDVIQNMAMLEQETDIDLSTAELVDANNKFLYDLDGDLKNMREKIIPSVDNNEMWNEIEKSLQEFNKLSQNSDRQFTTEVPVEMIFSSANHYLVEFRNSEKFNDKKNVEELLQKGIQLYKEGYFSEATLAFEAVVQIQPDSESGWSYLGMSLSENEQDHRAVIACNKCLKLNKNNREVLLSLARIHCNEMNLSSTISCLEQWLLANPKYSDLATVGQEAIHSNNQSTWDDIGQFAIIDEQLNLALNRNDFEIDPELEIAAGTLYHAVQDYARATVRFEAAVNVVKDNACLWNKLGTAYCNAGNYERAINAYRKALEFAPGFARAECNLGVAFYNMEAYKDAIEHAIKAYKIQHVENQKDVNETYHHGIGSDPIWTLIRMAAFKLNRQDLDLIIFSKDVQSLSKEFGV